MQRCWADMTNNHPHNFNIQPDCYNSYPPSTRLPWSGSYFAGNNLQFSVDSMTPALNSLLFVFIKPNNMASISIRVAMRKKCPKNMTHDKEVKNNSLPTHLVWCFSWNNIGNFWKLASHMLRRFKENALVCCESYYKCTNEKTHKFSIVIMQ